jgi:molecular chaperone GrpE
MTKRTDREDSAAEVELDDAEGRETGSDVDADVDVEAPDADMDGTEPEGQDESAGATEPGGHVDEVGSAPEDEVDDPAEELEILRDRHLRLAAEFDNYRRRTRRELLQVGEASKAELAGHLLEIIDDLTRVAEAPCDPEQHQAMHDGVGLIARKLTKTLADAGVEPVNPLGERFDPNVHEAVILTPTDDPEQDEHVSQVLLVGYRLGDRLLRPARVAVYRHDEG